MATYRLRPQPELSNQPGLSDQGEARYKQISSILRRPNHYLHYSGRASSCLLSGSVVQLRLILLGRWADQTEPVFFFADRDVAMIPVGYRLNEFGDGVE